MEFTTNELKFLLKTANKNKKNYHYKFVIILIGHPNILVLYKSSIALEWEDTSNDFNLLPFLNMTNTHMICVDKRKIYFD